jgi:4-carboxymuconolactone decarboxylase
VEGYGKVLGRPGLALRTRELCIVALLVGQDARPQLYAHLRGALNAGAPAEDVGAALAIAAEELGAERGAAAHAVWRRLSARHDGGAPGTSESTEIGG